MRSFTQDNAKCEIFTFKEGLLAAIGHDLQFHCADFELHIADDGSTIEGTFNAHNLSCDGAIKRGQLSTTTLSSKDVRDILNNISTIVFKGLNLSKISFKAEDCELDDDVIDGDGELHFNGRTVVVPFEAQLKQGRFEATVTLDQRKLGLKPFSALMGTLRIKSDILIKVSVPWS